MKWTGLSLLALVVPLLLFGRAAGRAPAHLPDAENGPDLPPGGFTRSCSGCHVDREHDALRCDNCVDGFGAVSCADAVLSACTSFMNNDGALECTRSLLSNEEGDSPELKLPPGPYLATCGGCLVLPEEGNRVLECTECPDARGVFHITHLRLKDDAPCKSVVNMGGRLRCEQQQQQQEDEEDAKDIDNNADAGAPVDVERVARELEREVQRRNKPR